LPPASKSTTTTSRLVGSAYRGRVEKTALPRGRTVGGPASDYLGIQCGRRCCGRTIASCRQTGAISCMFWRQLLSNLQMGHGDLNSSSQQVIWPDRHQTVDRVVDPVKQSRQ
jgi:hypothetical protein